MSKAIENPVDQTEDEKNKDLKELVKREYKEGFVTDIESDTFEPGLNEDIVRRIFKRLRITQHQKKCRNSIA